MGSLAAALARQVTANRSGVGHERDFASHRERMTEEIAARAPAGGAGRLCLLGAGNANDVDLDRLTELFSEVHLVDLDPEALHRALTRVSPAGHRRARLVIHAPVDLSGIFPHLDGWARTPPDVEAIADAVEAGIGELETRLPGPFDLVVSCCMLSQLQLVLVEALGERHPRFEELRVAINHVHVLSLAGLLAPRGVGLLVTDLTSSETHPPLAALPEGTDLGRLMSDLIHVGNVIAALHPGILSSIIRHDEDLRALYAVRFPVGPWIWHNGPIQTYLVYGLEIQARKA